MLLLLGLTACGHDRGTRVDNHRPFVRVTGGPIAGDTTRYTAELFWSGWDDDGVVDHYQYALDIPDHFTAAEINDPRDVGIAWRDTSAFRASFLLTTPRSDSMIDSGGLLVPRNRHIGSHTFWVRAVDNEGAISDAASVSFNAFTVNPRTTITIPRVVAGASGSLLVGRQVTVGWDGVDPDSPDPSQRPSFYEWKLIPMTGLLGVEDANYVVNVSPGPSEPWYRVGGDTTQVRVNLNPPRLYVFALRAVDEAGAREERFDFPRNALKLQSSSASFVGRPVLTIRERGLGTNVFPRDGQTIEFEIPVGRSLRFEFAADAQSYGGVIQAFNWGINVPDVEAEGPNSGFRGWSLIPFTVEPIVFTRPGVNIVTIKCRDTGGSVTVANYRLNVIDFPRDREVLYIDDFFLTRDPYTSDEVLDARNHAILEAAGYTDITRYDAWGTGDLEGAVTPPRLSDLARYRLVYWFVKGAGGGAQNGATALNQLAACGRTLQSYLSVGGGVWIQGQFVFGALKKSANACLANLSYDHATGHNFSSGEFPCDYLGICQGDIRIAKTTARNNGLIQALPTETAVAEFFPVVDIDSTQFAAQALGGLPFYDAMFQPTFTPAGGLDTLYTARPILSGSAFSRKPIAWRYASPVTGDVQGPVGLFGFPLPFMKPGSGSSRTGTAGLARSMGDWFRAHQGPPRH